MKNKRSSTAKMQIALCYHLYHIYLRLPGILPGRVLAVAQHVFSGGLTNYSYTLAPLLITLVLYLLQVGVYAVTRVKRRFHGLTYFPSFLILTMITISPLISTVIIRWGVVDYLATLSDSMGRIDMDTPASWSR